MRIGLLSGTKVSLPLMKLSACYKQQGHEAKLVLVPSAIESFDRLYVSRVFSLPYADEIIKDGRGYAIQVINGREKYNTALYTPLSDEIEHIFPDYGLYSEQSAHGFLTRGCKNNCGVCTVSRKESRKAHQVADLKDFGNGQSSIRLYDANLLDCGNREELLQQFINSKAEVDYSQGLDARLMDADIARLICKTKIKTVHFAFDNVKQATQILKGLSAFMNEYSKQVTKGVLARNVRVYILTNYNTTHTEDYYRVKEVKRPGITPYVTIYQKRHAPAIFNRPTAMG